MRNRGSYSLTTSMRPIIIVCGFALLIALCTARQLAVHFSVDWSGYRQWRVAQTKVVAGTSMTIDDMWWTESSSSHQTFLRILCHWNNGFPPNDYHLRASLLNASDGNDVPGMLTWYVPLPKTKFTPNGVTPFLWEFRTEPPIGKAVSFRVRYEPSRLSEINGAVEPVGNSGYVDFKLPNVAVEKDMSVADIFVPKQLFWAGYLPRGPE